MDCAQADQPVVFTVRRTLESAGVGFSQCTHHPRLGFARRVPYSADRGKQSVSRKALDELKHADSALDYVQPRLATSPAHFAGGRPHGALSVATSDHKPSFCWTLTEICLTAYQT